MKEAELPAPRMRSCARALSQLDQWLVAASRSERDPRFVAPHHAKPNHALVVGLRSCDVRDLQSHGPYVRRRRETEARRDDAVLLDI